MAKPWKVKHLDPDKPVTVCLKRILRTRIKEIFSYASEAVGKEDADGVHDMRVAVRRLKAVLAIFGPCFRKKALKKEQRQLKALLRALGVVRDGDIFIAALTQFREAAAEADKPGLDGLIAKQERERRMNRVQLARVARRLEKKNFPKVFTRFLRDSLACANANASSSIRPKGSLRENGRVLLPMLMDRFLAHRTDVLAHPAQTKKLHLMRIDGKRLRYGMEQFTEAYGEEYAHCLEEVKSLLDVMGTIHDCDVNIPKVRDEIGELRERNRNLAVRTVRTRVQGLEGAMRELKAQRAALFERMGETLRRWELEKLSEELVHSMQQEQQP